MHGLERGDLLRFPPRGARVASHRRHAAQRGSVKGKLRTRTLRGIPKRKCEFVGQAVVGQRLGDGVDCQREIDARCAEFQKEWDPHLSLKDHSCREHSAALASMLTGKEVTSEKIGAHVTPAFSA